MGPRPHRLTLVYALMLTATAGLFLLIRQAGEGLPLASGEAPAAGTSGAGTDVLPRVLVALAAVVLAGNVLGRLCSRIGQPPVVGEVAAGILLGPSFLGYFSRGLFDFDASAALLPAGAAPSLRAIAQLGIVLYMFLVGLELNAGVATAPLLRVLSCPQPAEPQEGLREDVLPPRGGNPALSHPGTAVRV